MALNSQSGPTSRDITAPNDLSAVTTPPDIRAMDDDARQEKLRLRQLGKTYGHIPGVPVFSTWENRHHCMNAAVHRSIMAGICGNSVEGVFSLVLSGGMYDDDEDGGETIIYTGSGGRQKQSDSIPPKRLHFGPQIRDQSWDDPRNKALITSYRMGNPIRLVRSSKGVSKYAPLKGYRYDGLYYVAAHWTGKAKNGFSICRCRLERLPDQPSIPIRPITISATNRGRKRRTDLISPRDAFSSLNVQSESPRQRRRTNEAGQSVVDPTREVEGTSGSGQQTTLPETPTPLPVEDTTDTKNPLQLLSNRRAVPPLDPASLPNYRWDPNTDALVEVPRPVPEEPLVPAERMDRYESEDDRTVAPDEDEDVDTDGKDGMQTEYFSDEYDETPEGELEVPH